MNTTGNKLFSGITLPVVYVLTAALIAVFAGLHIRSNREHQILSDTLPRLARQAENARKQVELRLEKFSGTAENRADLRTVLGKVTHASDLLKELTPESANMINDVRLAWEVLAGARERLEELDYDRANQYEIVLDEREQFCRLDRAAQMLNRPAIIFADDLLVADAIYAAAAVRIEALRGIYSKRAESRDAYESIGAAQKAKEFKSVETRISDARRDINVSLDGMSILPSDSAADIARANASARALAECADSVAISAANEAEAAMTNGEWSLVESLYTEAARRLVGAKAALADSEATAAKLDFRANSYQGRANTAAEIAADRIIGDMNVDFLVIDSLFARSPK